MSINLDTRNNIKLMYMASMDIDRVIFLTAKVLTVLWSAGKKNHAARGRITYRLSQIDLD